MPVIKYRKISLKDTFSDCQDASCPDAKQMYINGRFCYAEKFAILTNGLGIVRHITFLDDGFKEQHPELSVKKKSDSPEEDKTISDSA